MARHVRLDQILAELQVAADGYHGHTEEIEHQAFSSHFAHGNLIRTKDDSIGTGGDW